MGVAEAPISPAQAPVAIAEWSWQPWREHPWRSAAGVIAALALCVVIVLMREPPVVTIGLAVASVAALAPLFTGASCRVDDAGAERRGPSGTTRRRWEEIRCATLTRGGLVLSPHRNARWLDAWRALYLPFPSAGRDALRERIRPVLERHGLAG